MYMGSGPTPAGPAAQPRQRRRHTLDPTTRCCPKPPGPARGQTGRGHRGSPSPQDHRGIGHGWHQPCRATQGPVWSRRRPSAATVVLGGPWLAPGGPGPALVAAVGCAARTGAAGGARAGRPGQAVPADLVEPPRDWGQGPAEASRVTTPGRLVWRARALRVKPRVWRGGEVRAPRDRPLLWRLLAAREARGSTSTAGGLSRGRGGGHLGPSGDLARARADRHGRPTATASLAACRDRPRRPARRAATGGRDRRPSGRGPTGTRGDAPRPVARGRGHHDGVPGAAPRAVPGTPRAWGAPLPGPGTPPPDVARGDGGGRHGGDRLHAAGALVPDTPDDACDGGGAHGPWLDEARTAVVSWAAVALGTTPATWASLTGAQTPHRAMVWGPRVAVELPNEAEPLINWLFCPDNAILDWFSGSFARCLLSAISGHHRAEL